MRSTEALRTSLSSLSTRSSTKRRCCVEPAPEAGPNHYTATFELTIHGVTQTVVGRFEVASTSPLRVKGDVPLERLDFDVGAPPTWWNPASIDNAVLVSFEVTFAERS